MSADTAGGPLDGIVGKASNSSVGNTEGTSIGRLSRFVDPEPSMVVVVARETASGIVAKRSMAPYAIGG